MAEFTIVQTGRDDYVKELASSPFADIANACALGIANRQWDPNSAWRDEGMSYIEVREGEKTYAKVVLRQDPRAMKWVIE